jgi:hypothetical protein
MRSLGQGLSVGLLGAIAASGLGAAGARVIFLGDKASQAAASSFCDGYRSIMYVGWVYRCSEPLFQWFGVPRHSDTTHTPEATQPSGK